MGYVALVAGAAAALIAMLIGSTPEGELGSRHWVQYWLSLKPMSLVIALAASGAGAAIRAAQRSVLTAGVMIALALIPSAAIVGMGLVSGEFGLAGQAAMRWLVDIGCVDIGCVVLGGGVVFGAKRIFLGGKPANDSETEKRILCQLSFPSVAPAPGLAGRNRSRGRGAAAGSSIST